MAKDPKDKDKNPEPTELHKSTDEFCAPIKAADDGGKMAVVETTISDLLKQVDELTNAADEAKKAADTAGAENEKLKEANEKLLEKSGMEKAKPGDYVVLGTIKLTSGKYQEAGEKYKGDSALIASYMKSGAIKKVTG